MIRLLDKKANPFIPTSIRKIKHKTIFMIIKKLWIQEFNENTIQFKNISDEGLNQRINTNEEIIEFIIIDLLTNIKKYSNDYQRIIFDFKDPFTIIIENNISNFQMHKSTLLKTVNHFNNNQRLEINRRNNFGLAHIKDLSMQLNIDVLLKIDEENELFITQLEFKGDTCENTNI